MNRQTAPSAPRRRPKPHREHCPVSDKVRYRDAREATDALHSLTNGAALADELGGEHSIRVKRKYKCGVCRGWHLTSQATWTSPVGAQPAVAEAPGPGVPAPRRSDPLVAALARSLGLPNNQGVGLAA
jgi:hypothetical protein